MQLENMRRSNLVQGWFAAVIVGVGASIALGTTVTLGTAAMLVALSLVPPIIVMMLWPGARQPTAADVIQGRGRRR